MSQSTTISSQSAKKRGRKPLTIKNKETNDKKVPNTKAPNKPKSVSFKGKGKGKNVVNNKSSSSLNSQKGDGGDDSDNNKSESDSTTNNNSSGHTRKAYRCRPGTKAKREIRKLQTGKNATKPLLPYSPVEVIVKELVHKYGKGNMRIKRSAILAIKEALEADGIKQFEVSQILANHANRTTVEVKDLRAANLVRNIHPGKALTPNYVLNDTNLRTTNRASVATTTTTAATNDNESNKDNENGGDDNNKKDSHESKK
jgi:histone H3/H4